MNHTYKNNKQNNFQNHDDYSRVSQSEKLKRKHIDFRVTDSQYDEIKDKALRCGRSVSDYVRDLVIGYVPHLLMTRAQEKALAFLGAGRSELVRFRNAFRAMSQERRKQFFDDPEFMAEWLQYVNYLIIRWKKIKNFFLDLHDDDSKGKIDSAR